MITPPHPAQFSPEVLTALRPILAQLNLPVHDPFAGPGVRLANLCRELDLFFSGCDIEDWPDKHCQVIRNDSTKGASYPEWNHVICTSPVYPNGVCDHFVAKDNSRRYTYRNSLGRDLDPNNAGRYGVRHGKTAEAHYWRINRGAVRHWRGPVIVNVSDFIVARKTYPLTRMWLDLLHVNGYATHAVPVKTRRMRHGQNYEARSPLETILVGFRHPQATDEEWNKMAAREASMNIAQWAVENASLPGPRPGESRQAYKRRVFAQVYGSSYAKYDAAITRRLSQLPPARQQLPGQQQLPIQGMTGNIIWRDELSDTKQMWDGIKWTKLPKFTDITET